MALTALSPENRINQILRDLDCAVANFATIAGRLSGGRVATALSGQSEFNHTDAHYHLEVARRMQKLQADVDVPIDWRKVDKIKDILGTKKPDGRPTPFEVVVIGQNYFVRVSASGEVEVTTDLQQCAAFKDWYVARAAGKLLDQMGQFAVRVVPITNVRRHENSFINSLIEIGFNQESYDGTISKN